jgi:hypothetical protein
MNKVSFKRSLIPVTAFLSILFCVHGLMCPLVRFDDVKRYIPYPHPTGEGTSFVHGSLVWVNHELLYSNIQWKDLQHYKEEINRQSGGTIYHLRISDGKPIARYTVDGPVQRILVNHREGVAYALTPLSIWELNVTKRTARRLKCTIKKRFIDALLYDSSILLLSGNKLFMFNPSSCSMNLLKSFTLKQYDEFTSLFQRDDRMVLLFLNAPEYYELDLQTFRTSTFPIHAANYPTPTSVHLGDKQFLIPGKHSVYHLSLQKKHQPRSIDVGPYNTAMTITADKKTAYVLTGRGIAEVPIHEVLFAK